MLPSGKTDRKQLPPPRGERRLATRGDYVAPAEGTERDLAELLASVLRVERVSADSHFFDDLGADSLLMARFNAAIRDRGDLPAVSMKDIYLHPTIRQPGRGAARQASARRCWGPGAARRRAGAGPGPAGREPGPAGRARRRPGRHPPVPAVRRPAAAGLRGVRAPGRPVAERRPGLGRGGRRNAGILRPRGGDRRRRAAGHGCAPGRREVGPDRALEAAADPGVEPGLRPLLGGQDAGGRQPAWRGCAWAPRCTACTCGPWGRRSAGARSSSPRTCRCAPTC